MTDFESRLFRVTHTALRTALSDEVPLYVRLIFTANVPRAFPDPGSVRIYIAARQDVISMLGCRR